MDDFNSHNTNWGYDETNEDEKTAESWMDVKNLELIHDPKQPYSFNSRRHKRGWNPDLLFASQNIAPNCNKITLDKYSRHSSYVECNDFSINHFVLSTNFLFKFNVSLPLVTGE